MWLINVIFLSLEGLVWKFGDEGASLECLDKFDYRQGLGL